MQEWRKPAAGEFFYSICHSRIQINNESLKKIDIQKWRKLVAGEIFHSICHSRTQVINEIPEGNRNLTAAKVRRRPICLQHFSQSHTTN